MKIAHVVKKLLMTDFWRTKKKQFVKKLIKVLSGKVWQNTFEVIRGKKVIAYWWRGSDNKNWGDKINPVLIEQLSGKKVVHVDDVINFRFLDVHTCIGSVVEHLTFNGVNLWGPGIISGSSSVKINPSKIFAVRGPLTRKRLLGKGFDCPEIYGDPALLLPKYYEPSVAKKNDLGIVPHYVDKGNEEILRLQKEGAYIIDVFGGETEFIDEINRCKRVVSSSLHGLIVADAYGIPSKWIKASDNVFGDDFKYHDYYQSIGITGEQPVILNGKVTKYDLIESCWKKDININLEQLINACPYHNNDKKDSSDIILRELTQ